MPNIHGKYILDREYLYDQYTQYIYVGPGIPICVNIWPIYIGPGIPMRVNIWPIHIGPGIPICVNIWPIHIYWADEHNVS